MKHLDIEVAHVYGTWGLEQEKSLTLLENYLKTHEGPYKIQVLIDDYHQEVEPAFLSFLKDRFHNIATISMESSFESAAFELLKSLPTEIKKDRHFLKGTNILLKNKNRATCALLTACWYIYRSKDSSGLLNILPVKFKDNESKVHKILESLSLDFSREYIFFKENENESL